MNENNYQDRIITIPNLLTLLRLILIPVFTVLYTGYESSRAAGPVLIAAGLTDFLDGIIARRWGMESKVGQILDPIADKLLQFTTCLVLLARYPMMKWPIILLAVKELTLGIFGVVYLKKTDRTIESMWYGKASSVVHFIVVVGHVMVPTIRPYSSAMMISLLMVAHGLSLIMYTVSYIIALISAKKEIGTHPLDKQIMVMYLLMFVSVFTLLFMNGDTYLKDVLPKFVYLFLRFACIVGIIGIPAFFWGEKIPREKLNPEKFPFRSWKWENDGKIYEKIGIQYWKNRTPDMSKYIKRAFAKQGNLLRDPQHLHKLVAETCSAELVHWILMLLSPLFVLLMDECGVLAMMLYIVGNIISLIIQRYNRPRILKIIQRIERR